jgi:hypothetical protein
MQPVEIAAFFQYSDDSQPPAKADATDRLVKHRLRQMAINDDIYRVKHESTLGVQMMRYRTHIQAGTGSQKAGLNGQFGELRFLAVQRACTCTHTGGAIHKSLKPLSFLYQGVTAGCELPARLCYAVPNTGIAANVAVKHTNHQQNVDGAQD